MKIYVAGPYTKPDPCINTYEAIKVADYLVEIGHTPYIPHLAHFWHTMSPKPYDFWTEYDNEWIPACDAIYRMPGESPGAEKEIKLAKELGLKIYYELSEIPATI